MNFEFIRNGREFPGSDGTENENLAVFVWSKGTES